ncbi:Putative IS481 family integrase [Candidatus Bealeia paramacronuclearis]|uniref:IS481 family integrase n=2 Tax=Candidatus Bealeia paramacronuclearis TaxID=1921001 RepID=A0ABZ2C159_9PROT|nr:putative IS481 family integrase [Candidatus Bealeia paramacronuclearis]
MRIHGLYKNMHRLYAYARTQDCLDVYRKRYEDGVRRWEKLKAENVSDAICQEICDISRATYYRHKNILRDIENGMAPPSKKPRNLNKRRWGEAEVQLVLRVRRENPTYGKEKIAIILKRDHGQILSESTVGRILTSLKNKGLVQKSPSALRTKRKRQFKSHAKPWTFKDYKTMTLGERVQIDHMTVTKNGICFKHLQTWERGSKFIYASVYAHAKRFLLEFVKQAPFKIHSLHVDGGSEFMAEFEEACAELGIPLIVLSPKKPTYNGGVERGNRIFREEFYNQNNLLADSIASMRFELSQAVSKYNSYRPHRALKGLTPLHYIHSHILEAS